MNNDILNEQNKSLVYQTFLQREEEQYHHTYDEELLQYEYVRDGDMRSIEESKRLFRGSSTGKLSDDPVMDKKYLFVASTTLTTRFCIEGGMKAEEAYNLSDLFIQQMDKCKTIYEVNEMQTMMITDFTQRMAKLRNNKSEKSTESSAVSRPIRECTDYIYYHLHSPISINELADTVALSPNYLSTLFKKEKGVTIQQYIRLRRIDAAKNMLLYSKYSVTETAEFLAFNSASHFIRIFKNETGMTPKEYQTRFFRRHAKWSE